MSSKSRSVDQLIEDFRRDKVHNQTESTAETHLQNLTAFREWIDNEKEGMDLLDVGKRDVQDHLHSLDGYGNKSIGARFTAIQTFYSWCETEGRIGEYEHPTRNIDSGVKTSKTRKQEELKSNTPPAVKEQEVRQMLEHVPDPTVRNRLIIKILFQTGIRADELRHIRLQDIDRDERAIRIENAKSEGDYRTVFYNDLNPELGDWLDRGRRAGMRPANESDYLLLTNRSEQLSRNRPNRIVKAAADNAGIQETIYTDQQDGERKRITTHSLRHGFARYCVVDGMDISLLKELMGHDNIETTKTYLDFIDTDKKDAVRRHGPSV
jgi:integrase/recombinase XerD